jgi:hypothetical protein
VTKDGDLDCLAMYERHYSVNIKRASWRERKLLVGPGDKLVMRTADADAVFVWRKFTDDCIDERTGERQHGVNCAVFRNESQHLSSSLIRQADATLDSAFSQLGGGDAVSPRADCSYSNERDGAQEGKTE